MSNKIIDFLKENKRTIYMILLIFVIIVECIVIIHFSIFIGKYLKYKKCVQKNKK